MSSNSENSVSKNSVPENKIPVDQNSLRYSLRHFTSPVYPRKTFYVHATPDNLESDEHITNRFQRGEFGDVIVELNAPVNIRVQDILLDHNSKVLWRSGFQIIIGMVYLHKPPIKGKIDYEFYYTAIYVRSGFFSDNHNIFSGNLNVELTLRDSLNLEVVFSKLITDPEFTRNKM